MRHALLIVVTAILPLYVGGCGLSGGEDNTATDPSPEVVVPTATVAAAPNSTVAVAPTTTVAVSPTGVLPPDLISSTNSAQRIRGIQRNRPDPFALISTTPTVEIPPNQNPQPVPALPTPQPSVAPPLPPVQTQPLAAIPNLVNSTPPPLPLPPQPTLARAVKVTGVVQIGDTLHAIVDAPNEPSSRYVQAGQRLANGRVLVKRIEIQGVEPVVVLEQNGIEVITAVGSGGAAPTVSGIANPQPST
jgi:hypothetical protein